MSRFLQLVREEKMERVSLSEYTIKGILKPGVEPVRTTGAGDRLRQFIMGEEPSRLITVTRIPGVDDSALLRDLEAHSV
ncbi:MAG: hypothetical protein ACE5I9_11600 [Candidatus Methylomirabilales bacterium]